MKFYLYLLSTVFMWSCSGDKKEVKDEKNSFRVEFKLIGTEKTNNMTIGLRTSQGCYFTDKINNLSTKEKEEPENLTVDIKGDTACFVTNGKYVIISASCGSSTFQGAAMRMNIFKNEKLVKQLATTRLKPMNTILYNTIEDRL